MKSVREIVQQAADKARKQHNREAETKSQYPNNSSPKLDYRLQNPEDRSQGPVHSPQIPDNVHPHMFRHSFTTHLLEAKYDVSTVQSLLGHVHPATTLGYSHTRRPKLLTAKSPLDEF
ncbi:MAG: tyrosine-type recombinase/integrase [Candidatus Woesearchaeota archaeon]